MSDLNTTLNNMKKKYREIFLTSVEAIQKRVDEIKPDCVGDIFDTYAKGSDGYKWQEDLSLIHI